MKEILVTAYVNPDLDGLAGALAYAEFLNKTNTKSIAAIMGKAHDEANFVLARFNIKQPLLINNADNFDKVILVDASDLIGLEGNIDPLKVVEIIDHRKINEAHKFPNAKVQIEFVGAAASLIAEKFIVNNIAISQQSAILLNTAIISNTLNFKNDLTTQRDIKAYRELNKIAQLANNFWRELFLAKSDLKNNKLKERLEGDFAYFNLADKKVGIAQIEIIGVNGLIKERGAEMLNLLEKMKTERELDYIFLNAIELEKAHNYFLSPDFETKNILEKIFKVKFINFIAKYPQLLMRKQIVPLLKKEIEIIK